mgnify:CR=1 FL=1
MVKVGCWRSVASVCMVGYLSFNMIMCWCIEAYTWNICAIYIVECDIYNWMIKYQYQHNIFFCCCSGCLWFFCCWKRRDMGAVILNIRNKCDKYLFYWYFNRRKLVLLLNILYLCVNMSLYVLLRCFAYCGERCVKDG